MRELPRLLEHASSTTLSAKLFEMAFARSLSLVQAFDCRFYRLPELRSAAAFEVDSPTTTRVKISQLRRLVGDLPANVRFVGLDFECQQLAERLHAEGFDYWQPAIFVWEGVTN